MSRLRILTAYALSLGIPVYAPAAQGQEKAPKEIRFNHLEADGDRSYELNLSNGERFNVVIEQTCEPIFTYEVRGILRGKKPADSIAVAAGAPLTDKTLPVVHEDRYGGYIVSIIRTQQTNPCVNSKELKSRTLVISTRKLDWDLAFSGGFTVSNLTDPVFFTRPHPTVTGQNQVMEDEDTRDAANLGIGTFVHIYHHRLPWLAGVFGLGIRDGNRTEYFLGGGVRFDDKATLNVGFALGPVDRLPNGVNTVDAVSDANVLNNLSSRVRGGVFLGITYSFVNVRQKLEQPFAGSDATSQQPETPPRGDIGGAGSPGDTAERCTVSLEPNQLEVPQAGGRFEVEVTANAGCSWKVGPEAAWAVVSTAEGTTGPVKILVDVEVNDGPEREHKLEIDGATLAIEQAGTQ